MLKFKVFLHDVVQAYLQSSKTISRTVYLKPKSEDLKWFGVLKHEALKLRKPLYGLFDSGDYWFVTIKNHVMNDSGMVPCVSDLSLYLKYINGTFFGMTGNCVDDGLNSGTPEFKQLTERTMQAFEHKERKYGNLSFFGTYIHTAGDKEFFFNQQHYCAALWKVRITDTIEHFR